MHSTAWFLDRIVSIIIASLPLFLSAAVGVVALLQWRVARNKLRLDLFDRRYKVFEATRGFLSLIVQNAGFESADDDELTKVENAGALGRFKLATSDAEFLFGSDVVGWLAEVRRRAAHLRTTETLLERPPKDDDEWAKLENAKEEDLMWVIAQTNALTKVFTPYLGFAHVK
jgi:hypothetical protein